MPETTAHPAATPEPGANSGPGAASGPNATSGPSADSGPGATVFPVVPQGRYPDFAGRYFPVWAPAAEAMELVIEDAQKHRHHYRLDRLGPAADDAHCGGVWALAEQHLVAVQAHGVERYGFLVDSPTARQWGVTETVLPDPRSRHQPEGPHGLSACYDPHSFRWQHTGWAGRELAEQIIYELHLGTFTPEGTLAAAAERLPELAELGINTVELMPVAGFEGAHNWGYDGVNLCAIEQHYGGPEAYQRFVDTAHQHGLAVIQDVVFNHFGPSGNYAPVFGPYLNEMDSPWGQTLNFDGPGSDGVRDYVLAVARMFLADYRVDGLRLDAVHAIVDTRAEHILTELRVLADEVAASSGVPKTLIAESDRNDPATIAATGYRMHGQWCDDFHHGLHVALTGETDSYYGDFASLDSLVKVLNQGFFHDGVYSSFRRRHHGAPLDLATVRPAQLVVSNQTHDQIGNRAAGDRLSQQLNEGQLGIAAALTILSPFTPMLFMGEEFAAATPWQFFTDHQDPQIAEATRNGRRREFAAMGWDESQVPDPQAHSTFVNSQLRRDENSPIGKRLNQWYRKLLRLRSGDENFAAQSFAHHQASQCAPGVVALRRGERLIVVNFRAEAVALDAAYTGGELLAAYPEGPEAPAGAQTAAVAREIPGHSCLIWALD